MTAQLILGPRPGKKSKDAIQAQGVTHVLTLLSPREQPDSVSKIARGIGAEWHHFPIHGGHMDTLAKTDLSQLFLLHDEIVRTRDDAVIYLHCSAGIHRTGFVIYALLRYRGLTPEAAKAEVARLRPVTSEQVGEDRVALAEEMFQAWQAA
nr:tyrosine-protein phosphatase [Hyphomonas sp. Mor2]